MIEVEQHGRPDADGNAADCGDQRLLAARERIEKFERARIEAAVGRLEKIGNVVAGTERPGCAGEYDAANRIACFGLAQRPGHLDIHRQRERVLLLRAVDPDDADGAIIHHDDRIGH